MEVSLNFELAVYAAWTLAIGLLIAFVRLWPQRWHARPPVRLMHPGREVALGLAAVAGVVAISWGSDWLATTNSTVRAWRRNPAWGDLVRLVQYALIYSPIFALMVWRRQGLSTCFLRFEKLPIKIVAGCLLALLASFVFLLVRGRAGDYPAFLATLAQGGPVAMIQTFMEGLGIGFLLYRLGAWIGPAWSSVIVGLLFMAAHIPNYAAGTHQLGLPTALLMAAAHAGIAIIILAGVWISQDIIVLGFLHWFINRASDFTTA